MGIAHAECQPPMKASWQAFNREILNCLGFWGHSGMTSLNAGWDLFVYQNN